MTKDEFMELLEDPESVVESTDGVYKKGKIFRSVVITVGECHWMMTEMSDDWDCEYCEDVPLAVRPVEVVSKKWVPLK